ncbi:hypothetical protein BDD12DRAFT_879964 [Trichophaea hybrida]|nr:hypothetical protein BDD12DRAFT_879964 [Trichophaea hybrida]
MSTLVSPRRMVASTSSRLGTFATSDTFSNAPNPGLSIAGLGSIGLPLSKLDALRLIAFAEEFTTSPAITDTHVRDAWEIEGSKIKLRNERFNTWLSEVITHRVCPALGVDQGEDVEAQFYKMLLYTPGGHFVSHQDTIKTKRMFGTLIVVLPSKFEGGELHLWNNQRKAVDEPLVKLAGQSEFFTGLAAWYTNVTHSIKPVTSGYRLVLIYNLVMGGYSATPSNPVRQSPIVDAFALLVAN